VADERPKGNNRKVICDLCGVEATHRKTTAVPGMGRICNTHEHPCRICTKSRPFGKLVQVLLGQDMIWVCPHHPGVAEEVRLYSKKVAAECKI